MKPKRTKAKGVEVWCAQIRDSDGWRYMHLWPDAGDLFPLSVFLGRDDARKRANQTAADTRIIRAELRELPAKPKRTPRRSRR